MLAPLAAVAAVLALWELLVRTGLLSESSFPPMTETVGRFFDQLATGDFWTAVGNTLQGWALGLGIAILLAVPAGMLVGSSRLLYRALRVPIEFLRPIPSVALIPLAVLVYGTGLQSKVFLAAFASFWPLFVQTLYGMQDVDPVVTDTARSFGLGRFERIWRITLPERGALHRHRRAHLLGRRADPVGHRRAGDRRRGPRALDQRRAVGRRDRPHVRADHRHRAPRRAAEHPRHGGEKRVLHWHPSQRAVAA